THIIAAEPFDLDDQFGKTIFRFTKRQAHRGLQQAVAADVIQINLDLAKLFDVFENFIKQRRQVFFRGQWKIQHRNLFFQFHGNFHHRRNEDDGLKTVFEVQRNFFEFADNREIVLRQERMEIFENENRRLDL